MKSGGCGTAAKMAAKYTRNKTDKLESSGLQ